LRLKNGPRPVDRPDNATVRQLATTFSLKCAKSCII
jgi:hypothetical protein